MLCNAVGEGVVVVCVACSRHLPKVTDYAGLAHSKTYQEIGRLQVTVQNVAGMQVPAEYSVARIGWPCARCEQWQGADAE